MTVGTRVGCAIVENGRLLEGADACAGEFSYQQLIGPGMNRYRAGARLSDGLLDDPVAFGAALTGVIHVVNPNRIVLHGFAPGFLAAVQAHLDRYVFKTHQRPLETAQGDGSGSLLDVARHSGGLECAVLGDGQTRNVGVASDFLSRMIVCAPLPLDRAGEVYYGEIAAALVSRPTMQRAAGAAHGSTRSPLQRPSALSRQQPAWTGQPRSPQRAS